jgi:carbonic anhydrase
LLSAGCSGTAAEPPHTQAPAEPASQPPTAPAESPHWGYEGAEGPDQWGTLSPAWAVCGEGTRQSPIDIDVDKTVRANLPSLAASFRPAALRIIHQEHTADVVNTGHSIQVNYTEGDELTVGNERFELLQYHFHAPSEHTIGGKPYPMEMHMVHKSGDGKLAVVGVLIEEGPHNAAFEPVWANLPKARGVTSHLEHVPVDVNTLLPSRKTTYRYDGSLTTPPCTEGVTWIVMTTPIQLSATQLGRFRAVLSGNNRPVQPLNGRVIGTDHLPETVAR